jgi:hypothetical protein
LSAAPPADRRKLRDTIAALKAKTTAAGCTEAEAMLAAEKVAELLGKHGVDNVDDLEFDEVAIEIGRRQVVDRLWPSVATFCHCKHWLVGNGRTWKVVYFGRWTDVLVAEYLHELLSRQIRAATGEFMKSKEYTRRRSPRTKREAKKAFQHGFVTGLADKLWAVQWRRFPKVEGARHQDIVLSPLAPVQEALDRRDMKWSKPLAPVKGTAKGFENEHHTGAGAGRQVEINAAVTGSAPPIAGYLGR